MRGISKRMIEHIKEHGEMRTKKYYYWFAYQPDTDTNIVFEIMRCPIHNYIGGIVYGKIETVHTEFDKGGAK